MRAPISRDSMSRCEEPSMLYDTVRNPMARKIPPKPALDPTSKTLDTLESTQQRLNREMMERFQNSSSRVSHQTFAIAIQAGKYLFLAVMLPPYLCFYGLPRWFLADLMPQFFSLMKGQSIRIGKFFQEFSKRIADMMKGILEQTIGDSLRLLNRKSKNLLQHIAGGYHKIVNALDQQWQRIHHAAAELNHFMRSSARILIGKAKKSLQSITENKEKALNFAKNVVHALLQPLDLIDQFLIRPASLWTAKGAGFLLSVVKAARQHSASLASALKKTAGRLAGISLERISAWAISLSNEIKQGLMYLTGWVPLSVNNIVKWGQQGFDKIFKVALKAAMAVRNKARAVASSTTEAVSQSLQMMAQVVVQITGWAWWHSAPLIKQQWLRIREGRTILALFQKPWICCR